MLLTCRYKRALTLPFLGSEKGFGFKLIGGNMVGLFVSEVSLEKKELQVGDQLLEIAGHSALQMSYYEALSLIQESKDKLQLRVMQNRASEF